MYRTDPYKSYAVLLALLAIGLVGAAVFADRTFVRYQLSELHENVHGELAELATGTETVMREFMQISRGMAAAFTADPDMDQARFDMIAASLFQEFPKVRNVAAAPDLVIRYIYPVEGNEQALGLDYRTVPEQYLFVARARDTRQWLVDGPVALVQGGTGFIARIPVFVGAQEQRFWGIVAGVLDADDLFERAGLTDPDLSIQIAVRRVVDDADATRHVFGDPALFGVEHVAHFSPMPGTTWQWAAVPVAGWAVDPFQLALFRGLLLVLVLAVLGSAFWLVRTQRRLTMANTDLDLTLNAIPETLFEVGADGELHEVWSDPFGLFKGKKLEEAMPGAGTSVVRQLVRQVVSGGKATPRRIELPVDRDQMYFDVSASLKPGGESALVLMSDRTALTASEERERVRHAVLEKLGQGTPVSDLLDFIAGQVTRHRPSLRCAIVVHEPNAPPVLDSAPELPVDAAAAVLELVGAGARSRRTVSVLPSSIGDSGIRQALLDPVLGADGALLATAVFLSDEAAPDWPADDALIAATSSVTGLAIERARLNSSLAMAESIYRSSSEAMMMVGADERILAVNPAFTAITGFTEEEVVGKEQAFLRSSRHGEEFYRQIRDSIARTGSWAGEIWGLRKDGSDFASWLNVNLVPADAGGPRRFIALFSDISEKKKADELIWAQANYDALTQLPNRRLFVDRLEQSMRKAARDKTLLALLMVDLDAFKEVNDTLGHHFGDLLLVEAARRIGSCVRASDTVSRLGGDEFTIMMGDLKSSADVDRVTQKILDLLAEPFHIEGHPVYISGSVGITLFPDDADNAVDMLKAADQAMYESKRLGRNRYTWFSHAMQDAAQERMRLAADLRVALDEDQFHVMFQPVVDLASGRMVKAEALVRWMHPERGAVSPVTFIPIAEETGLIDAIGNRVLTEALRRIAEWRRIDPAFEVSINVSPVQFQEKYRLHERWVAEAAAAEVDPSAVIMEITEGVLISPDAHTRAQLFEFQQSRFAIAIDDFGTGYSSLSYLRRYSVDYLKIDRSFTAQLTGRSSERALCEAIIEMSHKLSLKVIAEGVETDGQHRLLREMGCDFAQGYRYARPMDAEELTERLTKEVGAP